MGSNYNGRNAWPEVEDCMRTMRMNNKLCVKSYKTRFMEIQGYVYDFLDETLAKSELQPQKFPETKLCKIISNAISPAQKK